MPVVEARILEGYAPEEKKRLIKALTDAIRFVVPAAGEAITVFVSEYSAENYARGGQHRSPSPALPDPSQIVLDYLRAMENRDLDAANISLGEGFSMVFPGNRSMTSLTDLIDWAQSRYRFVKKAYSNVEAFQSGDVAVVYTQGALSGEWPDGSMFEGIRFIDRFELSGGKIIKQEVWNDLAEVRANG
ncbi:MAG: tautomerase [Rhodobacteraceae bacterium]|nr:tautomerase [Paracoccaceae bacterium]